VDSSVKSECRFFASPVELGPNGAEKVLGIGEITPFEAERLKEVVGELVPSIESGLNFGSKL
jgi:malate dehydrogenase